MERHFTIRYPDDYGEMWMNKDNLMLCINAYCKNENRAINASDITDGVDHLRTRNAELESMLKKIADALNTPWPFPKERTEHDDILVESAVSAGQALQTIGTKILKSDWSQYEDIPPIVEKLEAEIARLQIEVDVAESMQRHSPAPCGHSSQYCYTEDGGKHIICLLCEVERLRKALESIKHKGDYDLCRCGRETGIYYITRIASAALEASDG